MRSVARRLCDEVRDLPILSPHGHVDPRVLLADQPFDDPTGLLVTPDHYVKRLLHASGLPLDELGVGPDRLTEAQSRAVWRRLCSHWEVYRGTPVRYWLESELADIFGVGERPSSETTDSIYDQVAACLAKEEFRPRALFSQFGIEVLATTDDPVDDLSVHAALHGVLP